MSSVHDDVVAAVVVRLTMAADGALLGVALAYVAVRSLLKLSATSSALRQIRNAPSLHVSDLRSLLEHDDDKIDKIDQSNEIGGVDCGKLVVVRGVVDAKREWKSGMSSVLVGNESGEKGVILERTQTCIYHEWKGFFGWPQELGSLLTRKQPKSSSMRTVPFVLSDAGIWPHSKYVIVNMDGSRHPLPLVTVYHHFQPVSATPYTFLQALFGHQYPVGVVDEEKILPLGKEITAVGFCTLKSGTPEIKSSKDLPYFLSDLSKDQMIVDLAFKTKVLLWTGVVLGSVAIGVLTYATMRNWTKWKEWRQQRLARQQATTESDDPDAQMVDDDIGEVPDGELCVICLTRRRRSAFVPCGHLVCCQRCALRIEREGDKKCPVCMQPFQKSVRIYNS